MFQPAICEAVATCPMPYGRCGAFFVCASAGTATKLVANAMTMKLADLDILNLAVRPECPGENAVVVINRIDAADFTQGRLARLDIAGVVHRARLQEQF